MNRMARINKTTEMYRAQLKNKGITNIPLFIQSIIDADITKGKYSRFLLDCFLNNKFHKEDLIGGLNSTVGISISLFNKHKGKLPEDMRSVYKYNSPGDLWIAVKEYKNESSGKEIKKDIKKRIYEETEFVFKDDDTKFQIISPLTEDSAKWWGKGTRWCTAADNNNMFWNYAKYAPLFILIMPNGEKLQLWKDFKLNEVQFMDEADNNVQADYIKKNWDILEPILMWIDDLEYIPDEFKTPELCEMAVEQNGMALNFVPEELRTYELCMLALNRDVYAVECVPYKFLTPELCEIAVQQNGKALNFVLEELKTPELCRMAVEQNGMSIFSVPEKYKTPELCRMAVKQNGWVLEFIPDELKTYDLCKIACEQDGDALIYVPDELKTYELCEIAVKQNGHTLEHIPKEFLTEELITIANSHDKQNNQNHMAYHSEIYDNLKNHLPISSSPFNHYS